MRAIHAERLSQPFTPDVDDSRIALTDALGIPCRAIDGLWKLIFDDLDETIFGIGWWAAYPGLNEDTRILLSDYLHQTVASVEGNLLEAHIHLLELEDALDRHRAFIRTGLRDDPQIHFTSRRKRRRTTRSCSSCQRFMQAVSCARLDRRSTVLVGRSLV